MRKRRAWRWERWPQSRSVQRGKKQLQQWDRGLGQPSQHHRWASSLHTLQGGRSSWMELDRDRAPLLCLLHIPTLPTGANASCKLWVTPKCPNPAVPTSTRPHGHICCSLEQNSSCMQGTPPAWDQEDAWHELASPIPTATSFLAFFPCLSYFFCFFLSGDFVDTSKGGKKKKKLITEKSYVLCWQIAQGALSALIRLCRGAAARCCPQPPAGS